MVLSCITTILEIDIHIEYEIMLNYTNETRSNYIYGRNLKDVQYVCEEKNKQTKESG